MNRLFFIVELFWEKFEAKAFNSDIRFFRSSLRELKLKRAKVNLNTRNFGCLRVENSTYFHNFDSKNKSFYDKIVTFARNTSETLYGEFLTDRIGVSLSFHVKTVSKTLEKICNEFRLDHIKQLVEDLERRIAVDSN